MRKNIYKKPVLEEIMVEMEAVMANSIQFDTSEGATGGRAKEYPKGMNNWQED